MHTDRRRTASKIATAATVATALAAALVAATGQAPAGAAEPGSIAGHVEQTGHVISPGIDVSLFTSGGAFVDHTVSDGYGDFTFDELEPGGYKIEFENQHEAVLEWYDNASAIGTATTITVDGGSVTTIDSYLTRASENVTPPSVTGTATVGSTLTATTGSWFPAPQSFAFTWLRGTTVIPGATAATYVVTAADAGQRISVRVTATASGYTESATSAGVGPVPGEVEEPTAVVPASPPVVTGSARVGATLRATGGAWAPASAALSYQWLRGGTAIAGATAAAYRLTAADAGRTLQVRVTASSGSLTPAQQTSAPTAAVARASSRLMAAATGLRRAAEVGVRVATAGPGTGRVAVTLKGRGRTITRTVALRAGAASLRITGLKAGRYSVVARYAGDAGTLPATARATVRVRR